MQERVAGRVCRNQRAARKRSAELSGRASATWGATVFAQPAMGSGLPSATATMRASSTAIQRLLGIMRETGGLAYLAWAVWLDRHADPREIRTREDSTDSIASLLQELPSLAPRSVR
jgi:hypothetical protein